MDERVNFCGRIAAAFGENRLPRLPSKSCGLAQPKKLHSELAGSVAMFAK
jgi:hypothetical protein